MSRFLHFYTRFKNHENSQKLEEPLLTSVRQKREVLASSLGLKGTEGRKLVNPNYVIITLICRFRRKRDEIYRRRCKGIIKSAKSFMRFLRLRLLLGG